MKLEFPTDPPWDDSDDDEDDDEDEFGIIYIKG